MKKIAVFFIILWILPFFAFSQKAQEVLGKIEQNIRNTDLLAYQISYKNINPTVEDSIYTVSGKTRLQRVPADSIFGARLHVQGKTPKGKPVDYYYDGQNSYVVRHADKEITIFDPYNYPNSPNNPAKTRNALAGLLLKLKLVIDENFNRKVLEDNPEIFSSKSTRPDEIGIILDYPENKYGQKLNRTIWVDKSTYFIKRIIDLLDWRGERYKTITAYSNYQQNDSTIVGNINLNNNYEQYSKKQFQINTKKKDNPSASLIGEKAPLFTNYSFSGNETSLKELKGKLILLDFWESWCGHCIFAMPELNKLQNKYSEDKLKIIGITTENKEQIERLIKTNNLVYTNIYADKSILKDYHITGRPTYILINKKGDISDLSFGDLEKIRTSIKNLLN